MIKNKGRVTQLNEWVDDNNVITYSVVIDFGNNIPSLKLGDCEVKQ